MGSREPELAFGCLDFHYMDFHLVGICFPVSAKSLVNLTTFQTTRSNSTYRRLLVRPLLSPSLSKRVRTYLESPLARRSTLSDLLTRAAPFCGNSFPYRYFGLN